MSETIFLAARPRGQSRRPCRAEVDRVRVGNARVASARIADAMKEGPVLLEVEREGETRYVAVDPSKRP